MNSDPQLHPESPSGISLLPEGAWTDYDRTIWEDFDKLMDDMLRGCSPYPEAACLGRYQGKPAILARSIGDTIRNENGAGFGVSRGVFDRTLVVRSWLYVYPEVAASDGIHTYEDVPFIDESLLQGDGDYDVFSAEIPDEFIGAVKAEMFPEEWRDYFDDDGCNDLTSYIAKEIGTVDRIKDVRVRRHIRMLLNRCKRLN